MARYSGSVCRLCRREGTKLFLKGDKCYTDKCPVERRAYAPGQHGTSRRKPTEYGIQLREKQKARRIYGVLEGQFRRTFDKASRSQGVTGEALLQLLESRLDNIVFRMGFAGSRAEARQLVRHGHLTVNDRKVNIPSYRVRTGDVITVKEKSRNVARIKELVESAEGRTIPEWLSVNAQDFSGQVLRLPNREEIDIELEEHLIIELYSR